MRSDLCLLSLAGDWKTSGVFKAQESVPFKFKRCWTIIELQCMTILMFWKWRRALSATSSGGGQFRVRYEVRQSCDMHCRLLLRGWRTQIQWGKQSSVAVKREIYLLPDAVHSRLLLMSFQGSITPTCSYKLMALTFMDRRHATCKITAVCKAHRTRVIITWTNTKFLLLSFYTELQNWTRTWSLERTLESHWVFLVHLSKWMETERAT